VQWFVADYGMKGMIVPENSRWLLGTASALFNQMRG
jgi:hypothetical protein